MDHKEFFKRFGQTLAAHDYNATNEQLYQIFKARLIEELAVTPEIRIEGRTLEPARLIDLAEGSNNNER